MLTPGDDYPLHQTPEPIAFSGTDRNFYDRYFFNGMSPDGSVFFAVAFGIYPQLDIMDGAFSVTVDGKQHSLRVSKHMKGDRLNLSVGPLSIEILEPLKKLRIKVATNDGPLAAHLTLETRHPPIEEPRFMRRIGTRAFMDYTRLTQNGAWSGTIQVAGKKIDVNADEYFGTRDRSWGVRPVGKGDSQPPAQGSLSQFFWLWTPSNFKEQVVFCHTNDDAHGRPWNRRAVVEGAGGSNAPAIEFEDVTPRYTWKPNSRRIDTLAVTMKSHEGDAELRFKTGTHFYMQGIGYTHPEWGHGMDRGPLDVGHETLDLATVNDRDPRFIHIQAISPAELDVGGRTHKGIGVVEQMFIGPHEGTGMTGALDPLP
jgi:hypothetical protein